MYDRAAYFSNGGFPEKIIFNEDMVYASKAMKTDMQSNTVLRQEYIIPIITVSGSSSDVILIWAYPRRIMKRFFPG